MRVHDARSVSIQDTSRAVHDLTRRSNLHDVVTLTSGATSTTVTMVGLSTESIIFFSPLTANASAEIGAGTMYVTAANHNVGNFIITHANNGQTDRTFRWAAFGD